MSNSLLVGVRVRCHCLRSRLFSVSFCLMKIGQVTASVVSWSRVLGYRSGGPGSIPGTTKKKVVGLELGPLSLVSTTEELLDRKIAAPV
jgi:hypothetical protein